MEELGITFDTNSDKWERSDTSPDYIYLGKNNLNIKGISYKFILDYTSWLKEKDQSNFYPLLSLNDLRDFDLNTVSGNINFLIVKTSDLEVIKDLNIPENFVLILNSTNEHFMPDMRAFFMKNHFSKNPIILSQSYDFNYSDKLIVHSSTDNGGF